jgi:hypothetical protein
VLGMDADQGARCFDRLGLPADLDSTGAPGIGAGEIVDDNRARPRYWTSRNFLACVKSRLPTSIVPWSASNDQPRGTTWGVVRPTVAMRAKRHSLWR